MYDQHISQIFTSFQSFPHHTDYSRTTFSTKNQLSITKLIESMAVVRNIILLKNQKLFMQHLQKDWYGGHRDTRNWFKSFWKRKVVWGLRTWLNWINLTFIIVATVYHLTSHLNAIYWWCLLHSCRWGNITFSKEDVSWIYLSLELEDIHQNDN